METICGTTHCDCLPDSNNPKYVVSLDEWTSGSNVEGIHHVHLADFLQMDL